MSENKLLFQIHEIDCDNLPRMSELEKGDCCISFGKYIPGDYDHAMNRFILQLKTKLPVRDPNSWISRKRYADLLKQKSDAIDQVAHYLAKLDLSHFTIVPVPPSKSRSHIDYDDRLLQILARAEEVQGKKLDVRELIVQQESFQASHLCKGSQRPMADQILSRYQIAHSQEGIESPILVFDDVMTRGSHFKAVQKSIKQAYPHAKVYGMFIAHTQWKGLSY